MRSSPAARSFDTIAAPPVASARCSAPAAASTSCSTFMADTSPERSEVRFSAAPNADATRPRAPPK